jgi:hypothetical protein
MIYRKLAGVFLLAALELAAIATPRAQGVGDVDNAMRAMQLRMRALNTSRKNLQQMEYHRDDHEADAAREISDADTIVFTSAVKVFTVGFILRGMKSPEDLHFAQEQFRVVVSSFITTADEELTRVNDNLHDIARAPALAEATNIRDLMVDLRDFLKPFVAKE